MSAHCPSSPLTCTAAVFARCRSVGANEVSCIPSGPVMPCAIATSRVTPDAASMTRPSQSALIPYSKRVPGSATSGAVNTISLPEVTVGVPVTSCQRTMSAFQNQ